MRRFGMALVFAVALVEFAAPTAFAVKPVTEPLDWTGSTEVTEYCPFPITVDFRLTGTVTSFFDRDGVLVNRQHRFPAHVRTGGERPAARRNLVLLGGPGRLSEPSERLRLRA